MPLFHLLHIRRSPAALCRTVTGLARMQQIEPAGAFVENSLQERDIAVVNGPGGGLQQ